MARKKRLIFTIYSDNVQEHVSANEYKRNQFAKYKNHIITAQSKYAELVNADYKVIDPKSDQYNEIQFIKLYKLDEFADAYDEILYLDFDVVPNTTVNFFTAFDLNTICAYSFGRIPNKKQLIEAARWDQFDPMNVYIKTSCKNAMLLLHDVIGSDELINTGVVSGNSKVIKELDFKANMREMNEIFAEACFDNIYPQNIHSHWIPNNEAFISYLIEINKVPFTNIGLAWNFILDKFSPNYSDVGHFIHHVNKEFELSFPNVE